MIDEKPTRTLPAPTLTKQPVAVAGDSVVSNFLIGRTRGLDVAKAARGGAVAVIHPPFPVRDLAADAAQRTRLHAAWLKEQAEEFPRRTPDPTARFPGSETATAMLSRDNPRASLQTYGPAQSRLVVRGCGPVPTRLPKRKPVFVEMVALGQNYRLVGRGITCDGEMVLPKSTAVVRVELLDLDAAIEVTVEGRLAGSRKKYGPTRWIERRIERPIKGRFRKPKPRI